jgi:hypothetical protein
MSVEGSSYSFIGRVLKVNPRSVANWVSAYPARLSKAPLPADRLRMSSILSTPKISIDSKVDLHMEEIIEKIKKDPRYLKNIEYGEPRHGHPEGQVKFHIAILETNLEILRNKGISLDDYWKLKFLIHVHDSFKAEAQDNTSTLHPYNHATLAKEYASEFTNDTDLLDIIQYHDENYELWKEYSQTNQYSTDRFQNLLKAIKNWDLFLMFIIIDGCTKGKDYSKLGWFINEVKKYKTTKVDDAWVLTP